MELSNNQKVRINTLPEDIRLKCVKKLGDGAYISSIVQARVKVNMLIDMYEIIDLNGLKGESAIIHAALTEYIKKHKDNSK
jgi:hypothetical protein